MHGNSQEQPVLILENFAVRRGSFEVSVSDLNLSVGSVILAGPNGSGKTSLMAALAGLLRWKGKAWVAKHPLGGPRGQSSIGYLPQNPEGLEHMRLRDALRYAAQLRGERRSAPDAVAEDLAVTDLVDERIGELSGGQRRLAYLALAAMNNPAVVLLDEPTSGIDASHRTAIRRRIDRMAKRSLVVTASHLPDDVDRLGYRTLVMRSGHVVFDGTNNDLRLLGERHALEGAGPTEAALAYWEREA